MHQPNTPQSISLCIQQGTQLLCAASQSARLDAELLLCAILNVPRGYLYAHGDQCLTIPQQHTWHAHLSRRSQGEPVAYILGYKDFWDLRLHVNPHVLIPRPETELLVTKTLSLTETPARQVLEVGTGSGAITCALAKARPHWQFYATDLCGDALSVAKNNAKHLGLTNIVFEHSDIMQHTPPGTFDVVISNPPYIDPTDPCLKTADLRYEPQHALAAAQHGMAIIRRIIKVAAEILSNDGHLYLEHGTTQGNQVRAACISAGLTNISTHQDLAGHDRITEASKIMTKGDAP